MGFPRTDVEEALRASQNNRDMAVHRLLQAAAGAG